MEVDCQANQGSCQLEERRRGGAIESVSMRCKQKRACRNNLMQNKSGQCTTATTDSNSKLCFSNFTKIQWMAPKSARFVASASRPTTRASEKTGSSLWNPERAPFPTGTSTTCERWSFCSAAFFTHSINICFFHKKSESVICANRRAIAKTKKDKNSRSYWKFIRRLLERPESENRCEMERALAAFLQIFILRLLAGFFILNQVHFLENLISKSELLKRDLRWAHRD